MQKTRSPSTLHTLTASPHASFQKRGKTNGPSSLAPLPLIDVFSTSWWPVFTAVHYIENHALSISMAKNSMYRPKPYPRYVTGHLPIVTTTTTSTSPAVWSQWIATRTPRISRIGKTGEETEGAWRREALGLSPTGDERIFRCRRARVPVRRTTVPIEGRRWLPKVGEIRRRLIDSRWDQVIGFCTADTVRKVLTHLSLIG